ncbi:histidine decarboxylase [Paramuricea clavata]|uniref:Histidine decarboxylase n=1 Tax=Paramuricea clavata TaxID=317549 RepID=A0A6S7FY29_PARCT|nr:histidine decarboxylase [Paramuricea clavata]
MMLSKKAKIIPERYHNHPLNRKEDARLSEYSLTPEQRESTWNQLHKNLFSHQNLVLGYQGNQNVTYESVKPFFDIVINNAGDPFSGQTQYALNTKIIECSVLDYFAKLWKIHQSDSPNDEERTYWGYVASMGCTEGNHLALYNAREYLAGMPLSNPILYNTCRTPMNPTVSSNGECKEELSNSPLKDNPNAFTPVVFFSEEGFHGLEKTLRMLQMKTFRDIGSGYFHCPLRYPDDYPSSFCDESLDENGWPRAVPVEEDGSISIPCLVKLVTAFVLRGYPPVVIFTSGTTFKGAYDDPRAAINELVPMLKQHNMYERLVHCSEDLVKSDIRNGFWFHIDGALGAAHLPFLEMAINQGLVSNTFPNGFPAFDFRIPEVKSIAMSIHKWFGCAFPSAVFMMRKTDQVRPRDNPMYVGGHDSTLSSSRCGHGVLVMWDLLSKKSYQDFTEIAARGHEMVVFLLSNLRKLEKELRVDLWLSNSPGSLFVCFKQPNQDIVHRYSLASHLLKIKSTDGIFKQRVCSHICLMSHVTKKIILRFIEELRAPVAFPNQN